MWFAALLLLWHRLPSALASPDGQAVRIEFFSQPACPRCELAKDFLANLQARDNTLSLVVHDVAADAAARGRLAAVIAEKGAGPGGVPAVLIGQTLIVGWTDASSTGRAIEDAIARDGHGAAAAPPRGPTCEAGAGVPCAAVAKADPASDDSIEVPLFGRVSPGRLGLPLFTIVVGLIDGVNPCAMWVLLYLLSILANLRSRAKMLAIAGTFVLISGLAYFAFMAAWLNFFRFIGYSRIVQIVLGVVAIVFSMFNLKDAVLFGRGPSLSIPKSAKPGIYARTRAIVRAERLLPAVAGAAVLAVLVNMVELLCTAGLPAVYTHLLAARRLPLWLHHLYLALYNLAYMTDDVIMLIIGVVTLSQRKLQERGGRILKAVSGVVMLALGLLLLTRPQWLR